MEHISLPNRPGLAIEFEADNQTEMGPCPDCGQKTKRVWGYIYRAHTATAAYFVEWTPTHPQKDAVFDLILGKWGEAAEPVDRQAVSVALQGSRHRTVVHGAGCVRASYWVESLGV